MDAIKPKYSLGENVTYNDSYWGLISGTIDMIGTQGKNIIYRLALANGGCSTCKESQIRKRK